jgi:RNA polymerase Rpb1, domain 2
MVMDVNVSFAELLGHFGEEDVRYLTLIDLDLMFANSDDALVLNHINYAAKDYVNRRNALVYARSGELSFVAHCDCNNYDDNRYMGLRCPECGTYCRNDFSSSSHLEHNTWLSIPPMIPGVLHPTAYIVLSKWLSRKGSPNYIDAIIDPTLDLPVELEGIVLGRGYDYFYHNFDALMASLVHYFRHVSKNVTRRRDADFIEVFVRNYRNVMFCTKLPVMSNVLHAITSSDGSAEGRQYADAGTQIILDAATDLANLVETTARTRPTMIPIITHRVYKSYITYIEDIQQSRLSRKKSLIRRHMLGTRLHFSVRAVIIPHMDRYDELYFPWAVTVNLLKLHIIGRLVRNHNMNIGDAVTMQVSALMRYNPLIDRIMKDLINECKPDFPGLPVLFNRNPSLRRGAIQLLFVTRVKPDVDDNTINISTLVLNDPNADFDGDAMNGVLLIEMDAARAFYVLHPSMRIRSINEASIGTNITLPKQSQLVLQHFLQSDY